MMDVLYPWRRLAIEWLPVLIRQSAPKLFPTWGTAKSYVAGFPQIPLRYSGDPDLGLHAAYDWALEAVHCLRGVLSPQNALKSAQSS